MTHDDVWTLTLETPSAARYLHIIRLTSAGAAAEAGLSADEIDDVKIAVDELCSLVMAVAADTDRLKMRFLADENGITIETVGPPGGKLEVDELAEAILDATVDELVLDDTTLGVGFRLTKHRTGG
ncbi:MAG: ATP-binding protein [Acidimicrobiales bacterium]